jgi:hypothetical protein
MINMISHEKAQKKNTKGKTLKNCFVKYFWNRIFSLWK